MSNDAPQGRFGLYLMVFIIMMQTCTMCSTVQRVERQVDKIEKTIQGRM